MRLPLRRRVRLLILFASFLAFPWTLNGLSPYLSVVGAWAGVIGGSVLVFAVLLLTAPVLGRSFCSWVCPGGFVGDTVGAVTGRTAGRPALWRVKWLVWAPWLVSLAAGWVVAGVHAVEPGWAPGPPVQDGVEGFLQSVGGGTLMATAVTVLFGALSLILGRRGGCHTICWMSPFLIMGRKLGTVLRLPRLALRATTETCTSCQRCTTACPMGVPVASMVTRGRLEHSECILCAECVDSCPTRTLFLGFGR